MDRSAELAKLGAAARDSLDEKHRAREVILAAARRTIQASAASIRATHRAEFDKARTLAEEARTHVVEADAAVATQPDLRNTGPLPDAKKELVEAWITLALVEGAPLPAPGDLKVDVAQYLAGMAEAASELRREVLDLLRCGDLTRAEMLVGVMDDVYSVMVTIDYPDGVTGGLRRTTDALRRGAGAHPK